MNLRFPPPGELFISKRSRLFLASMQSNSRSMPSADRGLDEDLIVPKQQGSSSPRRES